MIPPKSLGVAVAAAAVTAGTLYLWQQHRAEEAQALRTSNQELRREILARSRHAAQERTSASTNADPAPTKVSQPMPAATAAEQPVEADYRDEGQSTPGATLQTIAWACDRGDEGRMAKLIMFESAARQKAEAYLATLPPETRQRFSTAEALAAMALVADGMQRPYPRARLLARATTEPVSPDIVRVRLPGTPKDGGLYQRTSDGWKWLITEAMVDAYLAQAQGSRAVK